MHSDIIYAVIIAFIICLISGPIIIPMLRRWKFGQVVREEGPKTHLAKTGTPTMGGVFMVPAIIIAAFLAAQGNYEMMLVAVLITLGYGLIGFIDDFIKVAMRRSLGLRAYQKLIGQIGIALIFAIYAANNPDIGTVWRIPFSEAQWNLGWLFIPITVFVVVGTTNSVNLTDGIDGLAASVTLVVAATFALIYNAFDTIESAQGQAYMAVNMHNMAVYAGAVAGGCLGFLLFNTHPAKVFMGDTGSMALGGAVAAMAVISRSPLFLIIMGGVYVAEAVSVILQVVYFKLTGGKRIFKMTPIHHHFELSGMPEGRVVAFFTMAAIVLNLIAILAF
ncbi:MAG: phospho-N-acetylmuramoyl-pentapeptide-transferase [Clostridiales bacterium]|jgi:phospho-N-acetylmuramoyl-pentapeptide-transferase|nr:phospho-N-acetylmuramoyl-pentapeptide-transferase [Clostridiales bacterium]